VARLDGLPEKLAPLLERFLPRQRWYAGHETPASVAPTVLDIRTNDANDTMLVWLLVEVSDGADAQDAPDTIDLTVGSASDATPTPGSATYQLVLGSRPAPCDLEWLQGKERVTVGEVDDRVYYDALVDPELALEVLEEVAPDESAKVARPLVVEQSNSSVVYDEHLILKLFRRVHPEPNPDVEITEVLGERGFAHVVPQLAVLRHEDADLAVVREYLLGSTDAWQLAHTSLRDLLGTRMPPEEAGGDFGPEAFTLGEVTGRLHVAMAEAFGTGTAEPAAWLEGFRAQLGRLPGGEVEVNGEPVAVSDLVDAAAVDAALADLVDVGDPGLAIRIHGDLHLGQLLLADAGWFVLDFEGEPVRPVAERQAASSPLRDVAGMVRSFHYAARTGLAERGRDVDPELVELTEAWEDRAVTAYLSGYHRVDGVDALLPPTDDARTRILRAFELDKAVYEVLYELAHRPDWVDIPASAVRRTLALVA
jgi:maltokinase